MTPTRVAAARARDGPPAEQHCEIAGALPGEHGPDEQMMAAGISRAEARELQRYRHFYLGYPQIREMLTPE